MYCKNVKFVTTVFPRLVPVGIINLVFLADADTKQGQIVFEGGYYLACLRICVSFPNKNLRILFSFNHCNHAYTI